MSCFGLPRVKLAFLLAVTATLFTVTALSCSGDGGGGAEPNDAGGSAGGGAEPNDAGGSAGGGAEPNDAGGSAGGGAEPEPENPVEGLSPADPVMPIPLPNRGVTPPNNAPPAKVEPPAEVVE